jgi:hypothetical protein
MKAIKEGLPASSCSEVNSVIITGSATLKRPMSGVTINVPSETTERDHH